MADWAFSEFCFAARHFCSIPSSAQSCGKRTAEGESEVDDIAEKKEDFEVASDKVLVTGRKIVCVVRKSQ